MWEEVDLLLRAVVRINPSDVKIVSNNFTHSDDFFNVQNYPNPFNGSTTIHYQVNKAGHIQLRIIDLAGQSIQKLVDTVQLAGIYNVVWDSRDYKGRKVASGVYFYCLESDIGVKVRKMILVR